MTFKSLVYIVGKDRIVTEMFREHGYGVTDNQPDSDILCFIGGFDINPSMYNQKINSKAKVSTFREHDDRDINAWKSSKPSQTKVGICRGGQFLNVMNGGKLYQHVSNHANIHRVFDTVWNKELDVSSVHHQMMIPAENAEVFAYCENISDVFMGENDIVSAPKFESEVLWYDETKCLCFQGHPEYGSPKECEKYFFDLLDMVMQ